MHKELSEIIGAGVFEALQKQKKPLQDLGPEFISGAVDFCFKNISIKPIKSKVEKREDFGAQLKLSDLHEFYTVSDGTEEPEVITYQEDVQKALQEVMMRSAKKQRTS